MDGEGVAGTGLRDVNDELLGFEIHQIEGMIRREDAGLPPPPRGLMEEVEHVVFLVLHVLIDRQWRLRADSLTAGPKWVL